MEVMHSFVGWLTTVEWRYVLGQEPLEIIATLAGVFGLVLLAKEKRSGWLLGMVWSSISAYLAFFSWNLLSDTIMYLVYIPIQIYCWQAWVCSKHPNANQVLVPSWLSRHQQYLLGSSVLLCIAVWAVVVSTLASQFSWIPEPSMLIRDSASTVLNFFAQFLMARKRMENWVIWVIVNILGMHIYLAKGSPIYTLQYGLFLLLGLYGWWQWHKHRRASETNSALNAQPFAHAL